MDSKKKFVIAPGMGRAGTTGLYLELEKNQSIINQSIRKELAAFNQGADTFEKYMAYFTTHDKPVYLDCSPQYLEVGRSALLNMKKALEGQDVNIVVCLRNPVERAYSFYASQLRTVVTNFKEGDDFKLSFFSEKSARKYFCPIGENVKWLVDTFGRDRVHHYIPGKQIDDRPLHETFGEIIGETLQPFDFRHETRLGNRIPILVYADKHDEDVFVESFQNSGFEPKTVRVPKGALLIVNSPSFTIYEDFPRERAIELLSCSQHWTRHISATTAQSIYEKAYREDFMIALDSLGLDEQNFIIKKDLSLKPDCITGKHQNTIKSNTTELNRMQAQFNYQHHLLSAEQSHLESVDYWQNQVKTESNNPLIWSAYATRLDATGDKTTAEMAFEKSIALDDRNCELRLNYGDKLAQWGRDKDAHHQFETALNINSNDLRTLVRCGTAAYRIGKTQQAIDLLRHWVASSPCHTKHESAPVLHTLALALDAAGHSKEALVEAKRALEDNPKESTFWITMIRLQADHNDLEAVASSVKAAHANIPEFDSKHEILGSLCFRSAVRIEKEVSLETALPWLQMAVSYDENNTAYHIRLSNTFVRLGDYTAASEAVEKVTNLKTCAPQEVAQIRHNLALALEKAGRNAEALDQVNLALEVNSKDASYWITLIRLRSEHNDLEAVTSSVKAAHANISDFDLKHEILGSTCFRTAVRNETEGNPEAALPWFQMAVFYDGNNTTYHIRLIYAYVNIGEYTAAMDAAEKAIKLKSDRPQETAQIRHNLALALEKAGRHAEALDQAVLGFEDNPKDATFWITMIRLQAEHDDLEAVMSSLKATHTNSPDFILKHEALGSICFRTASRNEADGNLEAAASWFQLAALYDGNNATYQTRLSNAHKRLRKTR